MKLEEMESPTRSRDWEVDIMCQCNFSSSRSDKVVWNAALASVTGEVKVIDRLVEEFELPSHGPCPAQ